MRLQDIEGYTPITKNSIQNVKCTRIITGENSTQYNKYIQSLAKQVLTISATRTDGFKHDEVGILARLDGTYASQPILGYWDNNLQTSVIDVRRNIEYNFMLDESVQHSLVFVHNHPNNSCISINDAFELMMTPEIKCIVAIGNSGNIHYILKKSIEFEDIGKKIRKAVYHSKTIREEDMYSKILQDPDKFRLVIE